MTFHRFHTGSYYNRNTGEDFLLSQLHSQLSEFDVKVSPEGPWVCGGAVGIWDQDVLDLEVKYVD